MLCLVLVLYNQCDPLQLRQQAFAGSCPLLETISAVLDARVVNLVTFNGAQLDFFSINVLFVLDHMLRDEQVYSIEKHRQCPIIALFRRRQVQLKLCVTISLKRNLRESSLSVEVVPIEGVAKVMGLYAQKVDDLAEGGINLIRWHVYALSTAQAETTDCPNLVNCLYREDLIDEG